MNLKQLLGLVLLSLLFNSCDLSSTYEADQDIPDAFWHMDSLLTFDFRGVPGPQNIEVKFRSTLEYPKYNLYIRMSLLDSLDKPLANELLSFDLYDPKSGKPLGKGNSIYQYKAMAIENFNFPYEGPYRIQLAQYMRYAELPGIVSAGIRVSEPEN